MKSRVPKIPKKYEKTFRKIEKENLFAITPFGYCISKKKYNPKVLDKIRKMLTVKAEVDLKYSFKRPIPFRIFRELKTLELMLVPKFYGLENISDNIDLNLVSKGKIINVTWNEKYQPREKQQEPINKVLETFKDPRKGGGILNLSCGFGKTFVSLYILAKLKRKTLIIVNKLSLSNQWVKEIKKFMKGARIGFINGKTENCETYENVKDKDIVIALINSLAIKTFEKGTFREFGFLIADETHNYATKVFSDAFVKTQFRYTLGLSATPNRNDRLEKVFKWYLGPIIYQSESRNINKTIIVNVINYKIKSDYTIEIENKMGKPDDARMMNNISSNEDRTDLIVEYIKDLVRDPKRQILVVSHRCQHLKDIYKKLSELEIDSGLFMGKMKDEERDATLHKQVILGIYSLTAEAFNCEKLNTLIMATPCSNNWKTQKFKQIMGRILRKEHDINPIVVDIFDNFSIYKSRYQGRRRYYTNDPYYYINLIEIKTDTDLTEKLMTTIEHESEVKDESEVKEESDNRDVNDETEVKEKTDDREDIEVMNNVEVNDESNVKEDNEVNSDQVG